MKDFIIDTGLTFLLFLAWVSPFLTIITAAFFGEFLFAAGVLLGMFFVIFFFGVLSLSINA